MYPRAAIVSRRLSWIVMGAAVAAGCGDNQREPVDAGAIDAAPRDALDTDALDTDAPDTDALDTDAPDLDAPDLATPRRPTPPTSMRSRSTPPSRRCRSRCGWSRRT